MMYNDNGDALYLVWQYGDGRAGVKYPKNWVNYFNRPVVYLTAKQGMLSNKLKLLLSLTLIFM